MEILPKIGKVDAIVTDPPYGVLLGKAKSKQPGKENQLNYEDFEDTPEYIKKVVIPAINKALTMSKRGVITPGITNMFLYPKPDDFGVWYNAAACTLGRWGFTTATPIFWYGKNPKEIKSSASSVSGKIDEDKNNMDYRDIKNKLHPCPKPLKFIKWLVNKVSLENELILDLFMGSGTTGVACIELKRKFIGIEINENYFNSACKRLKEAAAQTMFDFGEPPESTPPPSIRGIIIIWRLYGSY